MTAGRKVNSNSHDWCTPIKYINCVKKILDGTIELDPCSNEWSIVGAEHEWVYPYQDGLKLEWNFNTIFVNPPYGSDKEKGTTIKNWIYKCSDANERYGSEVIALIPVATNTSHWKEYIWGEASSVCFLYDTRLKFLENGNETGKGAPMACAMVYWGEQYNKFFNVLNDYGGVVDIRNLKGVK